MPRGDDDDDNKCGKDDWEKVAKFLYRRFPTYESWNNLDGKGAMRQLAEDMRAKADYENTKAISMCAVGMLVATVQVEHMQVCHWLVIGLSTAQKRASIVCM